MSANIPPAASPSRWALPLFTLALVFSYGDRYVLSLVLPAVQSELSLSDTQAGLLQGATFALVYALASLPLARLLDRHNRIWISAACILTWSMASMLSSVAIGFAMLAICRAGIAAAEAGLPPAAISFFRDGRSASQAARASSVFMIAPFIGTGLALFGGGLLLNAFEPFGSAIAWRAVLITMAAPGLLLAPALILLVRDRPERRVAAATRPINGELRQLLRQPSVALYLFACGGFAFANNVLLAWYPSYLVRELGVAVSDAGRLSGPIYMVCGMVGALASILLSSRLATRGVASLSGLVLFGLALLVPASLVMTNAAGLTGSLGGYGVFAFASALFASTFAIPIQLLAPPQVRAQALAALFMVCGVAASIGTVLVGQLTDMAGLSLSTAMTWCSAPLVLAACAAMAMVRRIWSTRGNRLVGDAVAG